MRNTWLHTAMLLALAIPALLAARALAGAVVHALPALGAAPTWAALLAPPLGALALLVPGLVLGWFTRRHPLVVGAIAGAAAIALVPVAGGDAALHAHLGELLAATLVVAVATFAGRGLRLRFPPPAEPA